MLLREFAAFGCFGASPSLALEISTYNDGSFTLFETKNKIRERIAIRSKQNPF